MTFTDKEYESKNPDVQLLLKKKKREEKWQFRLTSRLGHGQVELSGGCIHLTGQIARVPTTPYYLPQLSHCQLLFVTPHEHCCFFLLGDSRGESCKS